MMYRNGTTMNDLFFGGRRTPMSSCNQDHHYCVYNTKSLIRNRSREHIIPRRMFPHKKHANAEWNVVWCDRFTNNIRSDYALGDPDKYRQQWKEQSERWQEKQEENPGTTATAIPLLNQLLDWKTLHHPTTPLNQYLIVNGNGDLGGMIIRSQRLFIPSLSADMVSISDSIRKSLYEYPYLYKNLNQIVESPEILAKY